MAITHAQLKNIFSETGSVGDLRHREVSEIIDEPVPSEIRHRLAAGRRQAAVLVPILKAAENLPLRLLLTQRTAHLRDHAGQISFPGGGLEPGETPMDGALREAQEEIGLSPHRVEVLGQLAKYHTGTGFTVTPVLGIIQTPCPLIPEVGEVAEIFDVPLDFILDRRNMRQETRYYRGAWRTFWAVPYAGRYIWGATAGMLVQLSRLLDTKEVL